jgi:hypothetical protein
MRILYNPHKPSVQMVLLASKVKALSTIYLLDTKYNGITNQISICNVLTSRKQYEIIVPKCT